MPCSTSSQHWLSSASLAAAPIRSWTACQSDAGGLEQPGGAIAAKAFGSDSTLHQSALSLARSGSCAGL
eukprot:2203668-Pyramimonas_sp.AAC.1